MASFTAHLQCPSTFSLTPALTQTWVAQNKEWKPYNCSKSVLSYDLKDWFTLHFSLEDVWHYKTSVPVYGEQGHLRVPLHN